MGPLLEKGGEGAGWFGLASAGPVLVDTYNFSQNSEV
jgi:hypothetical protein